MRRSEAIKPILAILITAVTWMSGCQAEPQQQPAKPAPRQSPQILAILPLTGQAASLGAYVKNGFQLYKEDYPNSATSVSLVDSKTSPKVALQLLDQAVSEARPPVVISTLSLVSGPVISKAESYGLFTIVTLTSSDQVIKGHTNVQRINPSTRDQVVPLARYAKSRGFRLVAIIYSFEEFGVSGKDAFVSEFLEAGRSVHLERYELDAANVRPIAQRTMDRQPDAVYVTGYGTAYLEIFKTLRASGFKGQILADGSFTDPIYVKALGEADSEGIVFVGTELELSVPRTASAQAFAKRYRQRFGADVIYNAAFAYDILAILDRFQQDRIPVSQSSFLSLKSWKGIVSPLEFLPGGECRAPMFTIVRRGGKNVPAE